MPARKENNKQEKRPRNRNKKWLNPFSPLLCRIGIKLLTFCAVAYSYGNITDGLPEYYDYEHILSVSHSFTQQLCYVFGGIELTMFYFQTNWKKVADSLQQRHPFLCWAVFLLIIAFIAYVGNFHQNHF